MAGKQQAAPPPPGTFSTSQGQAKTPSYACGCIHRQVLILLLAIVYLAIAVLAGIAVWAGIDNHQSYNNGQVKIDLDKYKVTRVSESSLGLSVGWLKYSDGINNNQKKDLSDLSVAAAVLGFLMAFSLLVSFIIAGWKFLGSCCIRKGHKSGGTCGYVLLGIIAIGLQFAFLIVTSRDMDNHAHKSLGVNPSNDIAMVPGYAWNCGTSAAFLWLFAAIFNGCVPTAPQQDYHKF